ncbi:MAG TPA: Hsp20/alpha crystallin family protein [Terriglobia bacterium]|nr:Hsp20/alpha crystallin family protein [Terriglobia bacterium]
MPNLLVRGNILDKLSDLRQDFDRVFDHFFKHPGSPTASSETLMAVVPPIETWVDTEDKEFHLTMPLPGLKPEEININLQGNRLTFSGEQKEEQDKTGKHYLEREFSARHFLRTITLPDGVEGDKLTAQLNNGILEITAPIAAAALPRKVEIKTAS